jgi:hypothetical protein
VIQGFISYVFSQIVQVEYGHNTPLAEGSLGRLLTVLQHIPLRRAFIFKSKSCMAVEATWAVPKRIYIIFEMESA